MASRHALLVSGATVWYTARYRVNPVTGSSALTFFFGSVSTVFRVCGRMPPSAGASRSPLSSRASMSSLLPRMVSVMLSTFGERILSVAWLQLVFRVQVTDWPCLYAVILKGPDAAGARVYFAPVSRAFGTG